MVNINSRKEDVCNMSVKEYLESSGYDIKRVAVERNGKIVPRAGYSDTLMKDGDSIEIVSFVGGG